MEEKLEPGVTYTLLREGEEIEDPSSGDDLGTRYFYIGSIVVEKILSDTEYALGMVTSNKREVTEGDILVPYIAARRQVSLSEFDLADIKFSGHIAAFEDPQTSIGGSGSVIFIDRGSDNGVVADQLFGVYKDQTYLEK